MKKWLVVLTLALGACSTPPTFYPTLQEQALSLGKGDLQAGGIAFVTPATVTGQEQEKQAVALTFADVLKAKRPELKVVNLAQTLSAVNRAHLAELRIALDSTRDEPVMLRQVLERSAADLVGKLP